MLDSGDTQDMKDKRKLGFLSGKGSIPDQKQLEEMDQEVSGQFFRDLMESAQEAVQGKPSHQISYRTLRSRYRRFYSY